MAVGSGESIYSLPIVSSYSYLGIDFSRNGAWDMHIRNFKVLDNGRKRVNQLHKVINPWCACAQRGL